MDDGGAVGVAVQVLEGAAQALGTGGHGAGAQPLVEMLAVDHADEAVLDRHRDLAVLGRDDAGTGGAGDKEGIRNRELVDGAGRDGAATGLDPAGPVEEQDGAAAAGELGRGRGTGGAAADHDGIEGLGHGP